MSMKNDYKEAEHSKQTETVVHFKNGSSINILNEQSKRGNRALLYPLYNSDETAVGISTKQNGIINSSRLTRTLVNMARTWAE